jgi:transposase-like protein
VPEQRTALVHAVCTAGLSDAEAARRYGVSRKTPYKWLGRFDAEPQSPLADRPRRLSAVAVILRRHGRIRADAMAAEPPACRWRPRLRLRPAETPEASYPAGIAVRRVGQVGWNGARITVERSLAGESVRGGQTEIFSLAHRIRVLFASMLRHDTTL